MCCNSHQTRALVSFISDLRRKPEAFGLGETVVVEATRILVPPAVSNFALAKFKPDSPPQRASYLPMTSQPPQNPKPLYSRNPIHIVNIYAACVHLDLATDSDALPARIIEQTPQIDC